MRFQEHGHGHPHGHPHGHRHQAGPHGFGRGGRGGGRHGGWGEGDEGRGGRRRRVFDQGELRLVLLKLIADQPSHGYELIKAIETAAGGAYAPSPGVIYPTLTLLDELGYVTALQTDGGKTLYTITDEGQAFLDSNSQPVTGLFDRMARVAAAKTRSSSSQ